MPSIQRLSIFVFQCIRGQVPQKQRCRETSHPLESSGQFPHWYQHYQRQNSRCERSRRFFFRSESCLYLRSELHRFRTPLYEFTSQGHPLSSVQNRLLHAEGLSRAVQAHSLLRKEQLKIDRNFYTQFYKFLVTLYSRKHRYYWLFPQLITKMKSPIIITSRISSYDVGTLVYLTRK